MSSYRRKVRIDNVDPRKLTVRQNYLLSRISGIYDYKTTIDLPEPVDVRRARKLIAAWDKKVSLTNCKLKTQVEQLRVKAREAVYFASEDTALNMIRRLDQHRTKCND